MSSSAVEAPHDVIVIGAGMAGLTAARRLAAAGLRVVVVDKGRALGGRMATRRFAGARFDHGAQHFSARAPAFRAQVERWCEEGGVREWIRSPSVMNPHLGREPRHVGVGGMRSVPERLASGLDVRTGVVVTGIERAGSGVTALIDGNRAVDAAGVILTAPVPQTLALLDAGHLDVPASVRSMLGGIRYDACLAVMATLDGPSGLPDGHLTPDDDAIAWIADNQHKGTSLEPSLTVHSTPGYAAAHLDGDPGTWTADLCAAAGPHLAGRVLTARGHRWRYARPRTTLDIGALALDRDSPVVLAGEVFSGARVEGAYLSGREAATQVLARRRA